VLFVPLVTSFNAQNNEVIVDLSKQGTHAENENECKSMHASLPRPTTRLLKRVKDAVREALPDEETSVTIHLGSNVDGAVNRCTSTTLYKDSDRSFIEHTHCERQYPLVCIRDNHTVMPTGTDTNCPCFADVSRKYCFGVELRPYNATDAYCKDTYNAKLVMIDSVGLSNYIQAYARLCNVMGPMWIQVNVTASEKAELNNPHDGYFPALEAVCNGDLPDEKVAVHYINSSRPLLSVCASQKND